MNIDEVVRALSERTLFRQDQSKATIVEALISYKLEELLAKYLRELPGARGAHHNLFIKMREEYIKADMGAYAGLICIEPWLHDRTILAATDTVFLRNIQLDIHGMADEIGPIIDRWLESIPPEVRLPQNEWHYKMDVIKRYDPPMVSFCFEDGR